MNSITLLGDTQVFRRFRSDFADVRPRAGLWIALVQVVAWLTGAVLFATGERFGNWVAVAALAAVAAYGERERITLRSKLTVSISLLPAIFAAVLFGPLAAMVRMPGRPASTARFAPSRPSVPEGPQES